MNELDSLSDIHLSIPTEEVSVSQFVTPRKRPELYPGTRPDWSFCFFGSNIFPIRVNDTRFEIKFGSDNWQCFESFIEDTTGVPLSDRFAVLAVGSNACPARLADSDKYGRFRKVAIPVLNGWINDVASVYTPWMSNYKSVPSTIMGIPGTRTKLWVTLLTEKELRQMDKSESRGKHYELVEFPNYEFNIQGGIGISPITAYYNHASIGLKDSKSNLPILLRCFDVIGSNLPRLSQKEILNQVLSKIGDNLSLMEINDLLKKYHSLPIALPSGTKILETNSLPSEYTRLIKNK
jgi:hypothetical protein